MGVKPVTTSASPMALTSLSSIRVAVAQPASARQAPSVNVPRRRQCMCPPLRCYIVSGQGRHRFKEDMQMNRVHAGAAILAASLAAAGCVSKGDYEKLEADKNTEIAGLKKDKTALEQQQAESKKQIDALEQQKAQIAAASQQDKSQFDALVRNLTDE